jgi:glycerol-3-phosphate acyltransferase PlsX
MKIALDVMGGDFAPQATIQGALQALQQADSQFEIVLVGPEEDIRAELGRTLPPKVHLHPASEIVTMDDRGSKVLKTKPDSSIVQGIQLVKKGQVDGFISAGNTGAIMATSLLLLGRIKGVRRPALGVYIPAPKGGKILCDVGANPEAKPHHLLQFAIMAAHYLKHVEGIETPLVGLINIGIESNKGSELYVDSYKLLRAELPNFIGNVEGRHIFTTDAHVLVCDGFVGNTLLKFAEGWISTFGTLIKESLRERLSYKLGALLLKPVFESIKKQYDYEEHGGTPLLGINGVCIISHGSSSAKAIKNSLLVAKKCIEEKLIEDIRQGVTQFTSEA